MAPKDLNVLLVEDNSGDANLTCLMFEECRMPCHVQIIDNGAEAIDFLLQQGKHATAKRPDLILMDLNLPKIDGRELLKQIKAHPKIRQIPVMILTSSAAEEDVLSSYDNHANCYLLKPMGLDELATLVRKVEDFWLESVLLPGRNPHKDKRQKDYHAEEGQATSLDKAS